VEGVINRGENNPPRSGQPLELQMARMHAQSLSASSGAAG
jgi:hypothetical protein